MSQLDHLEPLQLTTNFRSRPAVLRWINTWFRTWFDADAGQVPFAPLDHHVPESPATVAVVGRATDASAEQVARDQARDIARVIGLAHDSWLVRHDGAVNLGWLMLGFALSAATAQALLHRMVFGEASGGRLLAHGSRGRGARRLRRRSCGHRRRTIGLAAEEIAIIRHVGPQSPIRQG